MAADRAPWGPSGSALRDLVTLGFDVAAGASLQQVLSGVARSVVGLSGVLYGGIYLLAADGRTLELQGWHGLTADYLKVMRDLPLDLTTATAASGPPNARAVLTATTILVRDVYAEPELAPWVRLFRPQGFRGIAAVPLVDAAGSVLGSLTAYLDDGAAPDQADLATLQELGQLAAALTVLVRHRDAVRSELEAGDRQLRDLYRLGAVQHDALRLAAAESGIGPIAQAFADGLDATVTVDGAGGETLAVATPAAGSPGVAAGAVAVRQLRADEDQPATLRVNAPTTDAVVQWSIDGAALIIEQELRRLDRDADIGSRLTKDLVADLLSPAAMRHQDAVFGRAVALGHRPHHPHDIVMVALIGDPAGVGRARRDVERLTRDVTPLPVVGSVGTQVVVLNPVPAETVRPAAATRELAARLARSLPATARILIGPRADTLADAHHGFDITSRAVQLLTRDSPAVIDMTDLGVPGLLLQSAAADGLRDLSERTLGPLVRYDRERGASLLATLRTWLAHDMAAQDTARALFVHVNTINYRLRRIGEITGLQPLRPSDVIQLHLALTVAEIGGTLGSERPISPALPPRPVPATPGSAVPRASG
ncbi:helix-turn-helix domain-containing protein [Pseudonocardia sp. GCM10023141]|uniref:helix-turn-helix domain-containing protein n=1 Tax=Pseudonocardia sp. GCM10023141 TaxID=3252653 RepID=UPI003611EF8D